MSWICICDILDNLNELRLSNTLCDVILQIGSKSFPAHRVVLMARVDYFRNMFTADMREKNELTVQFDPLIIDPDVFGDVLNYIYTLQIDFTKENIRPIYKAADYFCFEELTKKMREHVKNSLYMDNWIFYRDFSLEFNFESLEADCEQFLIDSSSAIDIKNQLIPTLSLEDLNEFVVKLKENGKFEDMFEYSVDWVLHDKANRTGILPELLKKIPFELLSSQFIKRKVSSHKSVLNDSDSLELLLNNLDVNESGADSQSETVYAIGGSDGAELSSVSRYNSITRRWTATTPMPCGRTHFGCAVIEHRIYVCGGWNGDRNMNELTVFDTSTQTWTEFTPMKHARQNCAMAALNGQIYVAGGWNGTEQLAVVERYCVATDQWSSVAPMTTERSGHELVELNGFLYAIGGHDARVHALSVAEQYDPKTDQWTNVNYTNYEYNNFGSAALKGRIYIMGMNSGGVFDPLGGSWSGFHTADGLTEMRAPSKCRKGRPLAVYNDKLHVFGGELENWKGSKTVEVYDFEAEVWKPELDMDVGRCYHCVAVVKNV